MTDQAERVTLLIDSKEFSSWSECELTEQLDSVSTVTFKAPFDPEREEMCRTFEPFTYKPVEIKINDEQFFAGRMVGVNPNSTAQSTTVEVTAYAHAGWLSNVTMPGKKYPIQYKNMGLRAIATALGEPFGITVEIRGSDGSKFKRVKLEEDKKIWEFITELAKQRNLVWSNTPDGMLLGWRSVPPGNPVVHIRGDESPLVEISGDFDPNDYYSEITCFSKTTRKRLGNQYTELNKFLEGVLRPLAFRAQDTDPADAPEAAKAKLGRMLGSMASWTIENLPTWRDPSGRLWKKNTTLIVGPVPKAMIYQRSELLIRGVKFKQTAKATTATLNVVLPGSFSGEPPTQLPWRLAA